MHARLHTWAFADNIVFSTKPLTIQSFSETQQSWKAYGSETLRGSMHTFALLPLAHGDL